MNKINLKVVTLEGVTYQNQVDRVSIPTTSGRIGVLPDHVALVSSLAPGEMFIEKDGALVGLAMTTGFFEVRPGSEVVVMADTADRIDEMNVVEIEKAKARVEQILKEEENLHEVEFAYLEKALARELARLKIARKHHSKQPGISS